MRLPKSLKIAGQKFKVKYFDFDRTRINVGYRGWIRCNALEIDIDNTHPEQIQEVVLLHEIIHALDYSYKLDLDEDTVTRLGSALYQVLKDNKLF